MLLQPTFSAFSSVHNGENQLFHGGPWASATRRTAWAEGFLGAKCRLEKIVLPFAGSDMTSANVCITVHVRAVDGGYHDIFCVRDANIGRGENEGDFSSDGPNANQYKIKEGWLYTRNFLPVQNITLPPHLAALPIIAVQLKIEGHGWHAARNLQIFGEKVEDLSPEVVMAYRADYETDGKVFN